MARPVNSDVRLIAIFDSQKIVIIRTILYYINQNQLNNNRFTVDFELGFGSITPENPWLHGWFKYPAKISDGHKLKTNYWRNFYFFIISAWSVYFLIHLLFKIVSEPFVFRVAGFAKATGGSYTDEVSAVSVKNPNDIRRLAPYPFKIGFATGNVRFLVLV